MVGRQRACHYVSQTILCPQREKKKGNSMVTLTVYYYVQWDVNDLGLSLLFIARVAGINTVPYLHQN